MLDENQGQTADSRRQSRRTSPKVAAEASKILNDPNSSEEEKRVAASALSQAEGKDVQSPKSNVQGPDIEGAADLGSDSTEEVEIAVVPEPYKRMRFRAHEKSPTVEVAQGEYRRVFKKEDEPFAIESEEEFQMLHATGHFVEHRETEKELAADERGSKPDLQKTDSEH